MKKIRKNGATFKNDKSKELSAVRILEEEGANINRKIDSYLLGSSSENSNMPYLRYIGLEDSLYYININLILYIVALYYNIVKCFCFPDKMLKNKVVLRRNEVLKMLIMLHCFHAIFLPDPPPL